MSVKALTWAFEKQVEDARAKLVLLALADHANDSGVCWPGMDHLTLKSCSTRRTIYDKIKFLEKHHLIACKDRRSENSTNFYILNVSDLAPQAFEEHVQGLHMVSSAQPEHNHGKSKHNHVQSTQDHGKTGFPSRTTNQPSKEPSRVEGLIDSGGLVEDSRQVLSEHDFCSDDGTVVFTVEEFRELSRRHPEIKNPRGLIRQACRSWLLTHDPEDRKRKLIDWLEHYEPRALKKPPDAQTREERAAETREYLRATRDREEEVRKAKEVQRRLAERRAARLTAQVQ